MSACRLCIPCTLKIWKVSLALCAKCITHIINGYYVLKNMQRYNLTKHNRSEPKNTYSTVSAPLR